MGNFVNWTASKWQLTEMSAVERPRAELCRIWGEDPMDILLKKPMPLSEALLTCRKLKGELAVADSPERAADLGGKFVARLGKEFMDGTLINRFPCHGKVTLELVLLGSGFWAGYSDEKTEGTFVNVLTGESLLSRFDPFAAGEPNGYRYENCLTIWPNKAMGLIEGGFRGKQSELTQEFRITHIIYVIVCIASGWYDYMCGLGQMAFCHVKRVPHFNLRGLKLGSPYNFDAKYSLEVSDATKGDFFFDGYVDSILKNIDNGSNWVLRLLSNNSVELRTTVTGLPIGTHEFTYENGIQSTDLNINACNYDNEYNCANGPCVPMSKRY